MHKCDVDKHNNAIARDTRVRFIYSHIYVYNKVMRVRTKQMVKLNMMEIRTET